ncbi:MAG: hypothetical protein GY832_41135 [Chloroflexi bacterium]|nr:hypothetical protein [Chloroflexota bacterium]
MVADSDDIRYVHGQKPLDCDPARAGVSIYRYLAMTLWAGQCVNRWAMSNDHTFS